MSDHRSEFSVVRRQKILQRTKPAVELVTAPDLRWMASLKSAAPRDLGCSRRPLTAPICSPSSEIEAEHQRIQQPAPVEITVSSAEIRNDVAACSTTSTTCRASRSPMISRAARAGWPACPSRSHNWSLTSASSAMWPAALRRSSSSPPGQRRQRPEEWL